jgi:hypothetical protein
MKITKKQLKQLIKEEFDAEGLAGLARGESPGPGLEAGGGAAADLTCVDVSQAWRSGEVREALSALTYALGDALGLDQDKTILNIRTKKMQPLDEEHLCVLPIKIMIRKKLR